MYPNLQEMGNASSSDDVWLQTFNDIKLKHDSAFQAIQEAITLEEREKPLEAIEKYKEGIQLIDDALNVQVRCPENLDDSWKKACSMIQKIKKTRAEVLQRITTIQSSQTPLEQPPTYEEATSESSSDEFPRTYVDLATALNELSIDPNVNINEEIIYTHENVKLYFISPSGEVEETQDPQRLKISMVESEETNAPRAILQIGEWVYPLVPGVSPCYRTTYGAFILPNVYTNVPGSSVGIILPPDADEAVFDLLENILHGIISQQTESKGPHRMRRELQDDMGSKISNKIVNGAWYISNGLIRGAEKAGNLMNTGTPKLINQLQRPEQPTNIPPTLTKGMHIAETATNKAASFTGFVADKIGTATSRLGQFLAPHIQRQGTRLLSTGFNMSEQEASTKVQSVLTVAAGAVEGFSTVYRGLETSASILGSNLKNNTVKVVNHKYGAPAGELAGETLTTVGNVYTISQNTKILTPRGLVKRTAKDTGRAVGMGSAASTSHYNPNEISPSSSLSNVNGHFEKTLEKK